MQRIITAINDAIKGTGASCLPCDRVNLDYDRNREYADSEEHKATDQFEYPNPKHSAIDVRDLDISIPSIFRYFLDGSRRTYKVADLLVNGRYLPLIAGQIGVAVVERRQNPTSYVPLHDFCYFHNAIAFPDKIVEKDDISFLQEHIQNSTGKKFVLFQYNVKADRDPVELGIAKIMSYMADLELKAVQEMTKQQLLQTDAMLIKDGPLRYRNIRNRGFDVVQFRNVLGVSKTFRPSFAVGKGRGKKDVGVITSELSKGQRTPVYKTIEEDKFIGVWYLRLRDPERMSNPLQGIIKAECFAVDPIDEERGLESERITTLSMHLLRERNVTAFGTDNRWATHLYPIYMAENYIKANLISNIGFEALF